MIEMRTFPLDDIETGAEEFGQYHITRTRGVYAEEKNFDLLADGSMSIQVGKGFAWLIWDEFWGVSSILKDGGTLTFDTADSLYDRIDAIRIRADKLNNKTYVDVVKGTPASSPSGPLPVRDEFYDDLIIAYVTIRRASLGINADDIEPTVLNEELCGIMNSGDNSVPSAAMQRSFEELLQKIRDELEGIVTEESIMLKSVYDPNRKGIDTTIQEYTQSNSALTGVGRNGTFKATSNITAKILLVNGVSYLVKQGEETEIELITDVYYSFILDEVAKTINFKQGAKKDVYSEEETLTNKVYLGKPVYRKVFLGIEKVSPYTYFNNILAKNVIACDFIRGLNANLTGSTNRLPYIFSASSYTNYRTTTEEFAIYSTIDSDEFYSGWIEYTKD